MKIRTDLILTGKFKQKPETLPNLQSWDSVTKQMLVWHRDVWALGLRNRTMSEFKSVNFYKCDLNDKIQCLFRETFGRKWDGIKNICLRLLRLILSLKYFLLWNFKIQHTLLLRLICMYIERRMYSKYFFIKKVLKILV